MIVLTFKPRFHERILARSKKHTIRATRVFPVKVGAEISLRFWSGRPYMTPQSKLFDTTCIGTNKIFIGLGQILIDGLRHKNYDQLARDDGFDDHADMMQYFTLNRPLPFEGDLIRWLP